MSAATLLSGDEPTKPVHLSEVVVNATNAVGAYGQPAWANRSRMSPLTNGYVLSPYTVHTGLIWEGVSPQHGSSINHFTPEIELGLPCRTQIALETDLEAFDHEFQNNTTSIEFRHALADWNKIPLNPTLFAEWKFGTGDEIHDKKEMDHEEEEGGEGEEGEEGTPDSYELRLLLSQNFCEDVHWALNGFFEQEVGGDREREIGFSQSIVYAPEHSKLSVGVEMRYIQETKSENRDDAEHSFEIGPCFGYQITPSARLDFSPLFGIGESSPKVDAFLVFSYLFGSESEKESHQPISTMNR